MTKIEQEQLNIFKNRLKLLENQTNDYERSVTISKWTPMEWEARRRLKLHKNEIDFLKGRIKRLENL